MSFIPRLFLKEIPPEGSSLELDKNLLKYLTRVLRLKEGDIFRGFDGRGLEFELELGALGENFLAAKVARQVSVSQSGGPVHLTLGQSLPKGSKMDDILRQCTEAGVHRFVPLLTQRSVSRPEASQYDHKLDRWRKILVEACRQCGRSDLPLLDSILTFEEAVGQFGEFDLVLLPYEKEAPTLKTVLESKKIARRFLILVGPEGGWTQEEVELAETNGAFPVHLPTPILRTETAGLSVVSMVQYFASHSGGEGE